MASLHVASCSPDNRQMLAFFTRTAAQCLVSYQIIITVSSKRALNKKTVIIARNCLLTLGELLPNATERLNLKTNKTTRKTHPYGASDYTVAQLLGRLTRILTSNA